MRPSRAVERPHNFPHSTKRALLDFPREPTESSRHENRHATLGHPPAAFVCATASAASAASVASAAGSTFAARSRVSGIAIGRAIISGGGGAGVGVCRRIGLLLFAASVRTVAAHAR